MGLGDCFIQKCPNCDMINRKTALSDDHTCGCGYVWESIHNNHPKPDEVSKIEV